MIDADYNWICQPMNYTTDPKEMRVYRMQWDKHTPLLITGFRLCNVVTLHALIPYQFPMQIARALWWYYFSKFIEFFDTVSQDIIMYSGVLQNKVHI